MTESKSRCVNYFFSFFQILSKFKLNTELENISILMFYLLLYFRICSCLWCTKIIQQFTLHLHFTFHLGSVQLSNVAFRFYFEDFFFVVLFTVLCLKFDQSNIEINSLASGCLLHLFSC